MNIIFRAGNWRIAGFVKEFSWYAKGRPIYQLRCATVQIALKRCPDAEHNQGKGFCPRKRFILGFDGRLQLLVETLYHSIGHRMVGGSVYVVCAQQLRQILEQQGFKLSSAICGNGLGYAKPTYPHFDECEGDSLCCYVFHGGYFWPSRKPVNACQQVTAVVRWGKRADNIDMDVGESRVRWAEDGQRGHSMTLNLVALTLDACSCALSHVCVHAWPNEPRSHESLCSKNSGMGQ